MKLNSFFLGSTPFILLALVTVATTTPGCASRKKQEPSWHSMQGFVAPPARTYAETMEEEKSFTGQWRKFTKSLRPEARKVEVNDATSLALDTPIVDPNVYVMAGRMCMERGQLESAQEHYQRAIKINPKHAEAALAYGQFLAHQQKYDEAIAVFQVAVASEDPQSTPESKMQIISEIANCQLMKGEKSKAVATLESLVAQAPETQKYRRQLAFAHLENGNAEVALRQFADNMTRAEAMLQVGKLQLEFGQPQQARATLVEAFRLDANLAEARALLEAIDAGQTKFQAIAAQEIPQPTGRVVVQYAQHASDIQDFSKRSAEQLAAKADAAQGDPAPDSVSDSDSISPGLQAKLDLINEKAAALKKEEATDHGAFSGPRRLMAKFNHKEPEQEMSESLKAFMR